MPANTARLWLVGCRIDDTRALLAAHLADYRKPVEEVYHGVVLHSIDSGSLNILSGIEDRTLRRINTIPLWTPDFSVNSLHSTDAGNVEIICSKIKMISLVESATQNPSMRQQAFAQMVNFSMLYPSPMGKIPAIEAFWPTLLGNMGFQATTYPVTDD